MNRKEKILILILTITVVLGANWQFVYECDFASLYPRNDVANMITEYKLSSNVVAAGLKYVSSGTWIQKDQYALRPMSHILYWIEIWIGLHFGFIFTALIGLALFIVACLLSAVLAWQLTRSKCCAALAAVLAACLRFFNFGGKAQPDYWLAWFPVHEDILLSVFLMGAIVCFNGWQESAKTKLLWGAWACFLLAALTKEFAYIFPIMALAIALLRRKPARVELKWVLWQCALMMAGIVALWFYRAHVVPNPRNPQLRRIHFIRKPFLYLIFPFYKHMLTDQYWFPGLSVLLFSLWRFTAWWRASRFRALLEKPAIRIAAPLVALFVIACYCGLTYGSFFDALWYVFDPQLAIMRLQELAEMIGTLYSLWLLWKYRKTEPTALAFALMVISYLPVITYLGWHYTIPPWFVRSAYWALVAKCAWLETGPILLPRMQWLAQPLAKKFATQRVV